MSIPIVCIIGRPNVGKSTLFNRLVGRRLAVVDPAPGVTRDRLYAEAEADERRFALVDTGGLVMQSEDELQKEITSQAQIAIEEADAVIFLVDGKVAIHKDDAAIARMLLRSGKPAILAVNKIDGPKQDSDIFDYTRLGPLEPIGISALHGRATSDLMDRLIAILPRHVHEEDVHASDSIAVAIVGRPNVGKSSLVNRLLGTERMIVSSKAGTTRDSVDSILEYDGTRFTLIDTAGLRKAARVHESLEFYTTLRSIKAVGRADVVCIMIDASQQLATQDLRVAESAAEAGKAMFFAINKWDTVEKDESTAGTYVHDLHARAHSFEWAPVVFISALTGQRAFRILDMARDVLAESRKRIPTAELNNAILADMQEKPPPAVRGAHIKINYITQTEAAPPTFIVFCNHPKLIPESYQRFVVNRIRERYGFTGAPIRLWWRSKGKRTE
jgi:GTP-binding protein